MQWILQKCDILCIQEHWLLAFEGKKFDAFFPGYQYIIKCADDADPVPPKQRRRGFHGTAIVWKADVDPLITPLPDGSDRLIAIQIQSEPQPILLMNTYMPTEGAAQADYQENLDEVYTTINRYASHAILWTGDINASPIRTKATTNDKKLKLFLAETGLQVSSLMPDIPTFHHFNGTSTSRIDLFIVRESEELLATVTVRERDPTNTSPHDTILCSLKTLKPDVSPLKKNPVEKAPRKVNWEKTDISLYQELSGIRLGALLQSMDGLPISVVAERSNRILTECAQAACPPPTTGNKKKKFPWWSPIKPLAKRSVLLHKKLMSIPSADRANSPTNSALVLAKKLLRKAQRRAAAKQRADIKAAIIKSCKANQKNQFFKHIKEQRRPSSKTAAVDFQEHAKDTEENSWATYFAHLASPSENEEYDPDYKSFLETNYLLQRLTCQGVPMSKVSIQDTQKIVSSLKLKKAPDIFGLSAEHLRLAAPNLMEILQYIINQSIETGKLPDSFKYGRVCPMLKKSKSAKSPSNYRRITITSIIGKVVEKHMLGQLKLSINPQSPLQFGFTSKSSPIFAALALTEVLAEAAENKTYYT